MGEVRVAWNEIAWNLHPQQVQHFWTHFLNNNWAGRRQSGCCAILANGDGADHDDDVLRVHHVLFDCL